MEAANNNDINTVPAAFKNDLSNTTLRDIRLSTDLVEEQRSTFQIDLQYDLNLSKQLNGYIKVGGKYRSVNRARDISQQFMRPYLDGNENPASSSPDQFLLKEGTTQILLANFLDGYRNDDFFEGAYDLHPGDETSRRITLPLDGIDLESFNALFGTNYLSSDVVRYGTHIDLEKLNRFQEFYSDRYQPNFEVDLEDYDANEDILAAYVMAELNVGKWLMLMGGVRFEDTRQEYSSRTGSPLEEDEGGSGFIELIDVSAAQGYAELLPMAHIRIKPKEWVDLRLAVTRTLARPNFFNLVPWERIDNAEQEISRGKPDLKHTTAWNYDAFLSFYNRFGLFTIGGFYKELENIDYLRTSSILDGSIFNGYTLNEPANVDGTSTVLGVELDLQANLRALNGFWKGLVLGANLTLAESETFYPVFDISSEFIPEPPFFITTVIDTVRSGPIVGQADIIANFSLGYEVGGFSGRISAIHQSKTLSPGNPGVGRTGSGIQRIPELDFFDDQFWRFDLALKQKLDKQGAWTLLFNVNNLTNTPERALQGTARLIQEEEFFGFTAELGVLYKFKK
ncbi:MAG: TonB-dependent receptor [Bacteroidota bacterium]